MATIIFIHGRGQQGRDPVELEQEWRVALEVGLKKIDAVLPAGTRIVFPYYGNILHEKTKGPEDTLERLIEKGEASDAGMYFLRDMLQELLQNAGITNAQIQQNYPDGLTERGFQNWKWVIAMVKTVDKIPGLRDFMLDLATSDVYQYLALPHIREAIDKLVAGHIDSDPCVVVAHSLGTVVAYNVLHEIPSAKVDGLITLGSPLGIRAVKKFLNKPLKMPSCICNLWFNALDNKDIVALNPLTKHYFPITPGIINKTNLVNTTSNHHSIEGYLSNPEVAKAIYHSYLKLHSEY
ncbi:hypothetical protein CLV51_104149 [Chitinophaga niastensis]|uniref:Alpha/beta hydrolase family protein n=1 Tax=Chitinophaga niastensis TaxID=536980 RepID=A0A2P8HGU9_CHINA|nr:alpha/beta hydrolase [Chitinophaga niastensis]PSL45447.1 hypothetical protein CLV51_104149 [Chitinophaga niastensis]